MNVFARSIFLLVAAAAFTSCSEKIAANSAAPSSSSGNPRSSATVGMERPLILTPDEGEQRAWRPLTTKGRKRTLQAFTIKVDRQNGGSPQLWFGTSTIPVGAGINAHRHLDQDEMLYIVSGSAQVHVGSLDKVARTGSIVFIPRNTWISLKNIGSTPISLLFGFNAPGFDAFMRCESVPLGKPAPPMSETEDAHCIKLGDVQYR